MTIVTDFPSPPADPHDSAKAERPNRDHPAQDTQRPTDGPTGREVAATERSRGSTKGRSMSNESAEEPGFFEDLEDAIQLEKLSELLELHGELDLSEIVEELELLGHDASSTTVRRALSANQDQFELTADRMWRVRREPRQVAKPAASIPPGPVPVNAHVAPARPRRAVPTGLAGPAETSSLERELRDELNGRRLVAEIDMGAVRLEEVCNALDKAFERGVDKADVASRYPALLTCFLVGHGVYHYNGEFWPTIPLPEIDHHWGVEFERSLKTLDLESFEDIVHGDNGLRYVAPILAHGGVPKEMLGSYFRLLNRHLQHADSGIDLLSHWRTRRAPFAGISKAVSRFLLYGGDLAVDFIDRSIDLFREFERTRAVPHPREAGLPAYVVTAFKKFVSEEEPAAPRSRSGQRVASAYISIDPWTQLGPQATLPRLPSGPDGLWRVQSESRFEPYAVSRHADLYVDLEPSRSWTIGLTAGSTTLSEITFEGLDELTALIFDPSTRKLVRTAGGVRLERAWLLHPVDTTVNVRRTNGNVADLAEVEELPFPGGRWSGYQLREVDLTDVAALVVDSGRGRPPRAITVRPPAERASIVEAPVPHTYTSNGLPVYDCPPTLTVPPGVWTMRLIVDGVTRAPQQVVAEETTSVRLDLDEGIHEIALSVRGPLGADLNLRFVVCPGLEVAHPSRLIMPRDPDALISIAGPLLAFDDRASGEGAQIRVPDVADEVSFTATDASGLTVDLSVRVAKVLWAIDQPALDATEFSTRVTVLREADLASTERSSLLVRTGQADVQLRLSLTADGEAIQEAPVVHTRGVEGRWAFDLKTFADSISQSDAAGFTVELWVGPRPLTVARISRSLGIEDFTATSRGDGTLWVVDLHWEGGRQLTNRVVRLWLLSRPWDGAIEASVPDEVDGHLVLSDSNAKGLSAGEYLVEIVVDDGWATPVRPSEGTPGTAIVRVGSQEDALARLAGDHADAFDRLERVLITRWFDTEFDADDWIAAGGALIQSAAEMAADRLPTFTIDSHQFRALKWACGQQLGHMAHSIIDAADTGHVESSDLLEFSIEMAGLLARKWPVDTPDLTMRGLWALAPSIAAALDLAHGGEPESAARLEEFAGIAPASEADNADERDRENHEEAAEEGIPVGEPLSQVHIAMPAPQLSQIRQHLDLVPDQMLGIDSLVAAHFEWLQAEKEHPGCATSWWHANKSLLKSAIDLPSQAHSHLQARVPPRGTEPWAALPQLTLQAALMCVLGHDDSAIAARALHSATQFAPRLVRRDLTLAHYLVALDRRRVQEGTSDDDLA